MVSNEEYLDQLLASVLQGDVKEPEIQSESELPAKTDDSGEGNPSAEESAEPEEPVKAEQKVYIKEEILDKLDRDNMTWDEMMKLPIDAVLSAMEEEEEPEKVAAPEETTVPEEPLIDEPTVEEKAPEETAAPQAELNDDLSHMMSADEIAALLAEQIGEDIESLVVEEPVIEEPVIEEPVIEEPVIEEPVIEEPVIEEPVIEESIIEEPIIEEPVVEEKEPEETVVSEEAAEEELAETVAPQAELNDDPGHMMSADEIAALLAAQIGEDIEEPAEEELAETVAPQAELNDDPGHMMSADEIAALLAANEESSPVTEETTAVEEEEELAETVAPQTEVNGDPNRAMSADEIAALFETQEESGDESGSISEEDVEEQLEKAESQGKAEAEGTLPKSDSDQDLLQMIDELGAADEGLSDIADLLKKSDQNELVDENIAKEADDFSIDGGNNPADSEEGDKPAKEKKPGLFAKLFHALTDDGEDEEEDGDKAKAAVPEKDATKLSDENLSILNEIDAENEKKKAKKEKKEKKEKEKKAKKEKAQAEKKTKAPKKEKPKKAATDAEPAIRIPRKYVVRTFLVSFSLLAVILIPAMYLPIIQMKEEARDAYYQGDYEEAFLCLYGKKLDESDQLIYESARTIILLERKFDSYETYKDMQWEYQAIDALIQGVGKYEELYAEAERLGVLSQLNDTRAKIEAVLMSEYMITWDEAADILKYDALDYTNKLYSLVDGTAFQFKSDEINASYGLPTTSREEANPGSGPDADSQNGGNAGSLDMPDMLPEETDYINNQTEGAGAEQPDAAQENPPVPAYGDANGTPVDVEIDSNQF